MQLRRLISLALAGLIALVPLAGFAAQGSLVMPTAGTVSGLTLVNDINAALDALATCNSGATQPLNSAAAPSTGQLWCDNSVAGRMTLKQYDGTSWLIVAVLDTANHVWTPPIGGGIATSLASASTTDLGAVAQSFVTITGTTPITSFGSSAVVGSLHFAKFSGALTLTHNATSLILPNNGLNIATSAGDSLIAVYLGAGNWQVLAYHTAAGSALNAASNFLGAVFINGAISPGSLGASQNNWAPTGLATANLIRVSSSASVNITGITAPGTNGQRLTLQNINAASGFVITLTANDTNSTAANRFLFSAPVELLPGQALTVVYDSTSSGWRQEQRVVAPPIAGGFKNLRIFNIATAFGDTAPTTPNTQMKIAADELTVEDVNGGAKRLQSVACTIDISGNVFSAGSGGLDTGTAAIGNWYFLYVIFNPSSNSVSCLASLQKNAFGGSSITLPAGYIFAARFGANYYLTNNSVTGLQRIIQYGRRARYIPTPTTPTNALPIVVSNNTGNPTLPTFTTFSLVTLAPQTADTGIFVLQAAAGSAGAVVLVPNTNYSTQGSNTDPPPCFVGSAPGSSATNLICSLGLESANVYAAISGASTSDLVAIYGWEDNL